jgi:hypothetical protein
MYGFVAFSVADHFLKFARVLVPLNHIARLIVNANHGMVGVLKNFAYLTTLATPFGPPVK